MKREEMNDIFQYLIPQLKACKITESHCKIDVSTNRTGQKRGDIWISLSTQNRRDFERKIIALIEAKHKNCTIGDIEWREAMGQGSEKSKKQGLNYYIVTNCINEIRYYNSHNDVEISLDGSIITKLVDLNILAKIQTQITEENSFVAHKIPLEIIPISETKFRKTLKSLANIYRSAGLKKGDERIDPTVGFVVLKFISEKELEKKTLPPEINLWHQLREIALLEEKDLKVEFQKMLLQIWDDNSEFKNNEYSDFKDLISFDDFNKKLKNEHYKKVYRELDIYNLHSTNFDLFGAIYEEFASPTKKKEFGEFYTRRHITGLVSRLLLRNEKIPRDLIICDPACGAGGFLTEAFKTLKTNYSKFGKINKQVIKKLKESTFWGFDNDDKSVARTKLNMFLVGDGHIHIYENDSLVGWDKKVSWEKNKFDYLMTNPPMGQYKGEAKISNYDFTNESRNELLFTEKVVNAAKHPGEIAIVLNDGALEAPTREKFRKKLLNNCDIYAILSLTKFAFSPYTKEKTYILFMQKKNSEEIGKIQKLPIWHFIVDYDGYANSDKRYKTKYHDDLPELESLFENAVNFSKYYITGKENFEKKRNNFERKVNKKEIEEGLNGYKYKYVNIKDINKSNFHNLLSEFHLRPIEAIKISLSNFENRTNCIAKEISDFTSKIAL